MPSNENSEMGGSLISGKEEVRGEAAPLGGAAEGWWAPRMADEERKESARERARETSRERGPV